MQGTGAWRGQEGEGAKTAPAALCGGPNKLLDVQSSHISNYVQNKCRCGTSHAMEKEWEENGKRNDETGLGNEKDLKGKEEGKREGKWKGKHEADQFLS